jgi:hypothetical protein
VLMERQSRSGTLHVRGTVSKYVTNGSKTVDTDVTGSPCVSLGGSTVQLHDNLGSRRACA